MTAPMVEKVARAMFDSRFGKLHNTQWDFLAGPTNVSDEHKDHYREMASAAIAAMREPTPEMRAAAIDAALNEGKE